MRKLLPWAVLSLCGVCLVVTYVTLPAADATPMKFHSQEDIDGNPGHEAEDRLAPLYSPTPVASAADPHTAAQRAAR